MFQVTDLTLSNSGLVEFSISTVTCSRAGAKETETARRCTLALGGWKREGNVTELQNSTSKEGNNGGYGGREICVAYAGGQ